uniref:Uncharacterized protein n=1 Tax=Arundo donax TaxID=35708 RepID=A0A0A9HAE9_ARUDO
MQRAAAGAGAGIVLGQAAVLQPRRGWRGRSLGAQQLGLQHGAVVAERLRRNVQVEADAEQEVHLQVVHLHQADAPDLGKVGVVVAYVVHELDGGEHGGDEEAVDAVGVDGEREAAAAAQEVVEVHVGDDVAGGAAPGEPHDARRVRAHRDARLGCRPERRRRRHEQAIRRLRVVALRDPLQDAREGGHHARHVLGAALHQLLALGHGSRLLPWLLVWCTC